MATAGKEDGRIKRLLEFTPHGVAEVTPSGIRLITGEFVGVSIRRNTNSVDGSEQQRSSGVQSSTLRKRKSA